MLFSYYFFIELLEEKILMIQLSLCGRVQEESNKKKN